MNDKIWKVTQRLPENEQIVMCFGHRTCCCAEDMCEIPDWHKVKFRFHISFRLKNNIPIDLEESILDHTEVYEIWHLITDDIKEHIIGVTEWKVING